MSDPKKAPPLNPFTLFKRNRFAQAAGLAVVAVVLSGMVLLVPHLASHRGQPLPSPVANAPDTTSSSPVPTETHPTKRASPSPASKKTSLPPTTSRPGPVVSGAPHVMVIMEENKGFAATLGTCSADPYWCSLAATYASDTAWFGVSHPSEPNYVAIASGGIQGCTTDSSCAANSLTMTDLGGQLTAARIPWVAWMESMPSPCYTGGSSGGYALKHNPFGFFKDNYTGACHIQPYPGVSSVVATLGSRSAPNFVWITPNLTNDMHSGSVQQGDAWLRANLGPVLASPWFTAGNSTVIVTMDENDAQKSGPVPMVVISSDARGKGSFALNGNHYGTLRALEEVFGLGLLSGARVSVNGDLLALFGA
ncbi:MAG: alkaline phosphatase family protein [Candidatus Dormibacteraeota bacterium]|nr:alkaline phosphatase family protein [Candidatus Dormibacteraeota bacterium]